MSAAGIAGIGVLVFLAVLVIEATHEPWESALTAGATVILGLWWWGRSHKRGGGNGG